VSRAIARLLAREPADRYATGAELLAALKSPGAAAPAAKAGEKSIAVLPFTNMSADAENEYFSDGITEEIINALVQLSDLRVAARTSVFAFKGKAADLRAIADKLGVRTVLEGSVRKSGTRIRITAQLINAADGYNLWSERYDRELNDVFAVQDEIARTIAHTLKVKLGGAEEAPLVRPPTSDVEAYELYLQGRYFWAQRGGGLRKGLEYFQAALRRDPDYALAHAGLADAYTLLAFYGYARPTDVMPKALAAAERALALDPSLAEAHCSLGFIRMSYDWNLPEAEREFRQAIAFKPSHAPSHYWYAACAIARGDPAEAVARDERAVKLEPLSVFTNTHLGWMLLLASRLDDAHQRLNHALELDPRFLMAHWLLGQTLVVQGHDDEGRAELRRAIDISEGSPLMVATLGVVCASGQSDEARRILEDLRARSEREYVRAYLFARLHASLGEAEEAFVWLAKALEERDAHLPYAHLDRPMPGMIFASGIATDPRFASLMARRGMIV
jgi:TolB-like protein/Tfp pilus assembly protein PilF